MDIDTIGEKMCEQLADAGLVHSVSDFYDLTKDQLLSLTGTKEKSAENMLKGIEDSKQREFWRLLFGLNIRYVGEKTAQIITQSFHDIDTLLAATEEQIVSLNGIGPKVGHSVYTWLQIPANQALIDRLRKAGVNMRDEPQTTTGPLSGQTFLLTGKLTTMTRTAAEEAIIRLGGTIATGVSKNLQHLIVGEDAGSKLAKAQKAGVPIYDEQWLADLIKQYETS
jgi:DNA ligase (NAD+)